MSFISLHNHTNFSILNSLITPKQLFTRAKELGQTAVAITDYGSFAGVWDALKASKETGVKLIIGAEFYFVNDLANRDSELRFVVLIAKNAVGYKNLLTLNRLAFDNSAIITKRVFPVIDWTLLKAHSDGVICLTGDGNGIIGQLLNNRKFDEAEETMLKLHGIFGDNLGIEVQTHNLERAATYYTDSINQVFTNMHLIRLARKHNLRVVATTNTHYLKREDAKAHDVLLAIGSMQPVHSNARPKYDTTDLYLKSYDEVKAFFSRNYSEEFAEQICTNSIYLADLCEKPDWIDPKFTNPTGKELPVFPVEKEADFANFKNWLFKRDDIKHLELDKSYLRFKCGMAFAKKVPRDKEEEYRARLREELDVIEFHGFSSYMLIVADYIDWARKNGIRVGPGRGCLTGDAQVLTDKGFRKLDEICIGDNVYTHTGELKLVSNTFRFDVSAEKLLNLKLDHSFGNITLTKDHKVYGCKKQLEQVSKLYSYPYRKNFLEKHDRIKMSNPTWIKASDLEPGDYVYSKFPNHNTNDDFKHVFDIGKFYLKDKTRNIITEQSIIIRNPIISNFSIKEISRATGVNFEVVRLLKRGIEKNKDKTKMVMDYLEIYSHTIDSWQKIPSYTEYALNRFIPLDDEFLYVLGRWVGDGCLRHKMKNGIDIVFNKDDIAGLNRINSFFVKNGFNTQISTVGGCSKIEISVNVISSLLKDIFPSYRNSSQTKHLPIFFRSLSERQLKCLIRGLIDSDGHNTKYLESIKTTSHRLALEIREVLFMLKIAHGFSEEKANTDHGRNNSTSYKASFCGINRPNKKNVYGDGFYSKIVNITESRSKYVYDLTVNDDHSYLTSSGVMHNSVGGSLIAYLLNIHCADPVKYKLIFARFHNKDRSSFPDIDVDFAPVGRDKVQEYIRNKYGSDHVAHVSNINTITPKVYARDIARSCDLANDRAASVKLGDDIADSIPKKVNEKEIRTFDEAVNKSPLFVEYLKRHPRLQEFSPICGTYRAWATHAAGLVISKRPLPGLIPLRKDKDGAIAIEFDKDRAEENGLIKMDTLGLETLDIIDETYKLIKEAGKPAPPNPPNFDEYDKDTYDLISRGDTFCVFQLGTSSGTIDLCRKINPKSIEDISHINALARPSARNIREGFVAAKDGREKVKLLNPILKRAFGDTFGFGLYEESLMYLAQDVAGWSLHEADRLRKLTKEKGKNPKKVLEWRSEFINDAKKNNDIAENISMRVWDEVISTFSGYGFNMAHSIMYSMISYYTAYLKAHYPIEFLLANLMSEIRSNSKISKNNIEKIKQELRNKGINITPPSINTSSLVYEVQPDGSLLTGLEALKSVGVEALKEVIEKRPFNNFHDFISRSQLSSTGIKSLASSGCLDCFGISRKLIYLYCSDYKKKLQSWLKKHDPFTETFEYPWPVEKEWSTPELYALEKTFIGESFINKSKAYVGFFDKHSTPIRDIRNMHDKELIPSVRVEIKSVFEFKVKKEKSKFLGENMIKATVEDEHGEQITLTVFPTKWKEVKARIREACGSRYKFEEGLAIHFNGTVNLYEDEIGIVLENLFAFAPAPSLPNDLKAKKVSVKKSSKIDAQKSTNPNDTNELIDDFVDELFDEGLIDLEEENDDW